MVRSCNGRRTHRDFGRPNWRIMNYGTIRWLPNFDTCTTRNIGAWWFLPIRVGFKVQYDHTTQFHIEREFKVQVVAIAVDPSTATRFVSIRLDPGVRYFFFVPVHSFFFSHYYQTSNTSAMNGTMDFIRFLLYSLLQGRTRGKKRP